jgi:hypothetical protein
MPFDFQEVYRLRVVSDNFGLMDYVVLGVRPGRQVNPDTEVEEDTVEFVTNSYDNKNHWIFGEVVKDEGGSIEVVDHGNVGFGEGASPVVVWRFEPLTLHSWDEMEISGAEQIRPHFTTDADVQNFYRSDFLPDWWVEKSQPWLVKP